MLPNVNNFDNLILYNAVGEWARYIFMSKALILHIVYNVDVLLLGLNMVRN